MEVQVQGGFLEEVTQEQRSGECSFTDRETGAQRREGQACSHKVLRAGGYRLPPLRSGEEPRKRRGQRPWLPRPLCLPLAVKGTWSDSSSPEGALVVLAIP